MNGRRIYAFFYGLFMDADVLRNNGIEIVEARRAYADDYALLIGNRATLVAKKGARSYGMVMSVTHADISKLYSGTGLEIYRPEAMLVNLIGDKALPAICYNLLTPPLPNESNPEYAKKLQVALTKLDFPKNYIVSIA